MKNDPLNYYRRSTREVAIGNRPLGGDNPLRIQTMANVSTSDIEESVAQALRVAASGADYLRFTAQGVREAEALGKIAQQLHNQACFIPLVADIHFNPQAAFESLKYVEKVRINPGNFTDKKGERKHFSSDEEWYEEGAKRVKTVFSEFLEEAKKRDRAIRLGINHGSLSERMLQRWGNTPRGMVESCLEYLAVAEERNFHRIVISMKSSNVQVMTDAVRQLAKELDARGWDYPLHLGVTEAGEGEDGRVKSAVGIGSLLLDGLGDTLRVSLSEAPEAELPVARQLVAHITERSKSPQISKIGALDYSPDLLPRYKSTCVANLYGARLMPKVIACGILNEEEKIFKDGDVILSSSKELSSFVEQYNPELHFYLLDTETTQKDDLEPIKEDPQAVIVLTASGANALGLWRRAVALVAEMALAAPLFLHLDLEDTKAEEAQLIAAADLGTLLLEGNASGIMLESKTLSAKMLFSLGLGILQATRLRFSHTEFISCPGCGRTLYNLEGTIARIKKATAHLPNLKIGIMGCIVNGPGEMADADYGYVGGAPGKIDLYKGQECLVRAVPEENAVEALIELIRKHGDWQEPSE